MSKPVTIRFIGDESQFRATTEAAGGRLTSFGKRVDDASDKTSRYSERMGGLSERTDNSERNLIGLHDVIDGTAAIMAGPGEAGIAAYVQGWADLAGGVTPLIETIKGVTRETIANGVAATRAAAATVRKTTVETIAAVKTRALAVAQGILNVVMSANPIALVVLAIAALIAIIVVAYNRSETFRRIVQGAFAGVKAAASALWGGIRTAFNGIVSAGDAIIRFFRGLPGRIIGFLASLPGKLRDLGSRLIRAFVDGMKAVAGLIVDALSSLIPGPIRDFLFGRSPTKKGPLSEGGGVGVWGENLALSFVKGFAKGSRGLPGALGGLAGRPLTSFGSAGLLAAPGGAGGLSITINAHTNANPHDIGREVAWALRTSGR